MRLPWLLAGSLLALLAGCGDGDARQCTFNSDCPTGRYCTTAGACTADCTTDSECVTMLGAGAVCSSFGMCVAPPDAGGAMDAGGRDAGTPVDASARDAATPVDSGPDAGPPMEICTPSVPGAIPGDEDGDGAIDEGCPWHFGRAHAANTLQVDRGGTFLVALSSDGLRMYVTAGSRWVALDPAPACGLGHMAVGSRCLPSCGYAGGDTCEGAPASACAGYELRDTYDCAVCCNRAGAPGPSMRDRALFVAMRTSTNLPFDPPTRVAGLDVASAITGATLSSDELELIYAEESRTGRPVDLVRARRASAAASFGTPTTIAVLSSATDMEYAPRLSSDGLELWFTRYSSSTTLRSVWHARRAARAARRRLRRRCAAVLAQLGLSGGAVLHERRSVHRGLRDRLRVRRDARRGRGVLVVRHVHRAAGRRRRG